MNEKKAEKRQFGAEVSKILQLVIHSLYTNKDIFLRELISNASDACDKLRHEAITKPDLLKDGAELAINIKMDSKAQTLTISDSGIGMDRDELIGNLGTIAKSGTQEFLAAMAQSGKKGDSLIGQFGVGFYSAFMVADRVQVVSTKAGSGESWQWESDGQGEFTVAPVTTIPRGTTITLHLKNDAGEYLDKFRLRHIVQTYSDHISFSISLTDEEGNTETINTGAALWTRPKTEITKEQYTEFYRHVAHAPDEPWLTLHNKAEGKLEFTNLLFIPSSKPFDLFHPDRKCRVKLYVKRVFITENNIDIVPAYLRFLRGIVDSLDLPLNISRETLQHNPIVAKIRESIVRRVLSELKKQGEKDEEGYGKFWKNFGPVLKEGLCESHSPREQLLEVCHFHSNLGDKSTTLDAYISRMKEGQEVIYYLTGDHLPSMKESPQIEGFTSRGIEVLLMDDHVDDFWVNVVPDYKGKKFKSVTRADIDLDKIAADKKEEETLKSSEDNIKALCEKLKSILGDKVKDVRTTGKLTDSAVCLAVEEGAMDFRFERFLVEQKQLPAASAKILEINPSHPIIIALAKKLRNDPHPNPLPKREREQEAHTSPSPFQGEGRGEGMSASQEVEDAAWILFDQARIVEGEDVSDPAAFTRRLQAFLERSLAA